MKIQGVHLSKRYRLLVQSLIFGTLSVLFCPCLKAETIPSAGEPPPNMQSATKDGEGSLRARLLKLAPSRKEGDQVKLVELLGKRDTLDQLDPPEVRDKSKTSDLRLATILDQLQRNRSQAAAETLAALSKNTEFNESWQRQELLLRALTNRRPLPEATMKFLDQQTQADSVNLHIAIDVLCENGTDAAMKLMSRKMADPELDSIYKIGWMRGPMLAHRRDPILLQNAESWLQNRKFSRDFQVALAEALFDYKPEEWYPGREGLPRPPAEENTSSEAAVIVRRIGQAILDVNYPLATQAAVRRVLAKVPSQKETGHEARP